MMLKKDPNFTRLKKLGGRGYLGRVSYWLGVDHLLVVEVTNYNERYRRFYFRDLQAVIVQRNRNRMWGNIAIAVLGCLFLSLLVLAGFGNSNALPLIVIFSIVFLLAVIVLLINTVGGPMCSIHLRTAVQTQKLTGITRWRRAEFLIGTLTPLIQSAQSAMETTPTVPTSSSNPPAPSTAQPDFS